MFSVRILCCDFAELQSLLQLRGDWQDIWCCWKSLRRAYASNSTVHWSRQQNCTELHRLFDLLQATATVICCYFWWKASPCHDCLAPPRQTLVAHSFFKPCCIAAGRLLCPRHLEMAAIWRGWSSLLNLSESLGRLYWIGLDRFVQNRATKWLASSWELRGHNNLPAAMQLAARERNGLHHRFAGGGQQSSGAGFPPKVTGRRTVAVACNRSNRHIP